MKEQMKIMSWNQWIVVSASLCYLSFVVYLFIIMLIGDVKNIYMMALAYIRGFRTSIDNFSEHILPGNRGYISWGPRY